MKRRAVTLDAGGTLFHLGRPVGSVYAEYAERFGCRTDPLDLERRYRKLFMSRSANPDNGLVNPAKEKEWWRELVRELFAPEGGVREFDRFFEELNAHFAQPGLWKAFPEVMDTLRRLRESGLRLAIVSNWDVRLERMCREMGLDRYVETFVVSAVVGVSKPDGRIFRIALERLGTAPEETVHVGDSLRDDVWGALSCGMGAVWLKRGDGQADIEDPALVRKIGNEVPVAPDLMRMAEMVMAA